MMATPNVQKRVLGVVCASPTTCRESLKFLPDSLFEFANIEGKIQGMLTLIIPRNIQNFHCMLQAGLLSVSIR